MTLAETPRASIKWCAMEPSEPTPPPGTEPRAAELERDLTPRQFLCGLLLLLASFLGLCRLGLGYTVDDAFVTYRYAVNWADGHGAVFNVGQPAVEGYTSFLWMALISAAARCGVDPEVAGKVLGIGCTLAMLLTLLWLARRAGLSRAFALLAVALTAWSSVTISNALNALETPLLSLLALAAIGCFLRERERGGGFPWSLVLAGLATLTRPDGVLLFGVLALGAVEEAWRGARPAWLRWALLGIVINVAVLGAHQTWRVHTYGDALPNTFYAKPGGLFTQFTRGLRNVYELVRLAQGPLVVLLAIVGATATASRAACVLALGFLGTRVVLELWSGGAVMGHLRFLAPAMPGLVLCFAAGAQACARALTRETATAAVRIALALLPFQLVGAVDRMAVDVRYAHGLEAAHRQLGHALSAPEHARCTLAADDIGTLAYDSRRPMIDLMGLTDRHIARLPGLHGDKIDLNYVMRASPEHVVLSARGPHPSSRGYQNVGQALAADPAFLAEYAWVEEYPFEPTYYLWHFRRRDAPCAVAARDP